MEGCEGADSTQTRTLNRVIPLPPVLHPRLNFGGFRVSLISDCFVVF